MAKPQSADQIFNRMWEESMNFQGNQQGEKMFLNRHQRQAGLKTVMVRSAIRKELQREVMHILGQAIPPEDSELMDLMSGDAVSTIPLVKSGKLTRLVLVDDGSSTFSHAASEHLVKSHKLEDRIKMIDMPIAADTEPKDLPQIKQVVLAQSGLALPPNARQNEHFDPTDPQQLRSPHIFHPTVDLRTVLTKLFDGNNRVVHLIDAPFSRSSVRDDDLRNYVGDQIPNELASLQDWRTPVKGSRLFHAIVTNR